MKETTTTEVQEWVDELAVNKKKIILELYCDLNWYSTRQDDYDEEKLRAERSELDGKLKKDKYNRPKDNEKNRPILEKIGEIDFSLNLLADLKKGERNTISKIKDFETYVRLLKDLEPEHVEEITEVLEKGMPNVEEGTEEVQEIKE